MRKGTFSTTITERQSMIAKMEADERRFAARVSWECQARLLPLALEPQSPTLGIHHAIGHDISEGGVQVRSSRLFALKSNLLVEMQAPDHPEGIQVVGSVAWISPTCSENLWCLGIEFSDVGDNALNSIRALMRLPTTRLSKIEPGTR